jgi:hypothetical protein
VVQLQGHLRLRQARPGRAMAGAARAAVVAARNLRRETDVGFLPAVISSSAERRPSGYRATIGAAAYAKAAGRPFPLLAGATG